EVAWLCVIRNVSREHYIRQTVSLDIQLADGGHPAVPAHYNQAGIGKVAFSPPKRFQQEGEALTLLQPPEKEDIPLAISKFSDRATVRKEGAVHSVGDDAVGTREMLPDHTKSGPGNSDAAVQATPPRADDVLRIRVGPAAAFPRGVERSDVRRLRITQELER